MNWIYYIINRIYL